MQTLPLVSRKKHLEYLLIDVVLRELEVTKLICVT